MVQWVRLSLRHPPMRPLDQLPFRDLLRSTGEACAPTGSGRERQRLLAERLETPPGTIAAWWSGRNAPRGLAGASVRDRLAALVREHLQALEAAPVAGYVPSAGVALAWLTAEPDGPRRRLGLVGWLGARLRAEGAPPCFAVGGAVVEAFTFATYQTRDIDLKGRRAPIAEALAALGFKNQPHGSVWSHALLDLHIDWRGEGIDRSIENPDLLTDIPTPLGPATVIGVEDIILDRLLAADAYRDADSALWAREMLRGARRAAMDLDFAYMRDKAGREGIAPALDRLLEELS